jgi:glycosyltransferase involved in cell wall biosynthesis
MIRVLLRAAFGEFGGYSQDGIGIAKALLRMGVDLYLQPEHIDPPLPRELTSLLEKRLEAPFDLTIHHVDPNMLDVTTPQRRATDLAVAHTMWETSSLINSAAHKSLRKRLRNYDAVVGYSDVSTEALRPYVQPAREKTHTSALPVQGTIQGGYESGDWPEQERDWFSDRFGFCQVGVLDARKDPWCAIDAFRELKEEYPEEFAGAEYHIKNAAPTIPPSVQKDIPKLRLHHDTWPRDIMLKFYAAQHCLLAPSRGEGKNMPALEMLSTGGTTIATAWSGHQNWLNDEYSYALDYTLKPISDKYPDCLQARASKEHLKELMMHVYRNRDEARKKGLAGAAQIPQLCSWDTTTRNLFRFLGTLPDKGPKFLAKVNALPGIGEKL